ncbi:MAG: hypothetical protein KUG77_22885, partial [Nannocystaceae bacterium]|nr:hypothetical protein [Nannocystaceae bacterium]
LTGGHWLGTERLTADKCAAGTVKLSATPKPARVSITGVPPKTVVKCLKGCADKYIGTNQAADKTLHPIPLDGSGSQRVVFQLQAEGHRRKRVERTVHPGAQTISVKLDRRK